MRSPWICALLLTAVAPVASAAYSARDVIVPIVGHTTGGDGTLYGSSLWITNVSTRHARATITFTSMKRGVPSRYQSAIRLRPRETRLFEEVGAEVMGEPEGTGSLRVVASADILANARLFSRRAGATPAQSLGMSFAGIPARSAIGTGKRTTLQGVSFGDYRYKLYVTETENSPLTYSVTLLDLDGNEVARRTEYIGAGAERVSDVREMFANVPLQRGTLRIHGVNGNGRIVVAGSQIATGTQDGTVYEMSIDASTRLRIPNGEIAVYLTIAAVLVAAMVSQRRAAKAH